MTDKEQHRIKLLMWFLGAILVIVGFWLQLYLTKQAPITHPISQAGIEEEKESHAVPVPELESVSIVFVGDMMFDRYIRQKSEQNQGYDFVLADVKGMLQSANLVVGNLEGPITDFESISRGTEPGVPQNYIFTFAPEIIPTLIANNIKLVNLGNNHILNFGEQGLAQTFSYLNQAGIEHFGHVDSNNDDCKNEMLVKEINGIKLLFVNYNQFITTDFEVLLQAILDQKQETRADVVILYTHWGNEYASQAGAVIQEQAHRFIDSGVDVIIGSHPHVIQQKETYQGKTIYYSLGNFVFDQYFNQEVRQGLVVKMDVEKQISDGDSPQVSFSFAEQEVFLNYDGSVTIR